MLFGVLRLIATLVLATLLAGCGSSPANLAGGGDSDEPVLTIGAIPDQDPQELQRRYALVADYLRDALDVEVRYEPVTDYTASVTAFERGDLQLVFFGGLTGVQARERVPGAVPIAQRDIDAEFTSVFIAHRDSGLEPFDEVAGLTSLAGHSFTFGSFTSTSGRLMPQYFLDQAGVAIDEFSGEPGYSGSHDATAKLVAAGTYEAGALNAAVWDDRVASGAIDTDDAQEIFRTPPYHDYHWLARPDLDATFGKGFTDRVTKVLLGIDGDTGQEKEILDIFSAGEFIATEAGNYDLIESVARELGLLN